MPLITELPRRRSSAPPTVKPSIVDPRQAAPFTLDQELEPFGRWVDAPLWAPPKGRSTELAKSMLRLTKPFTPADTRWDAVVGAHRAEFAQVREIELFEASIRLPKGRFFVSVTEQKDFGTITDTVPACVQTRLEEFLAGPGSAHGVKVFYLKPLCVDFCDHLILTSREDVLAAIEKVRSEVFAEYAELAPIGRTLAALRAGGNALLAAPRSVVNYFVDRQRKVIDAYQAKIEFQRRKTALRAARTHNRLRTDGCSFDDMLALTTPPDRKEVVEQICVEQELSSAKRAQLMSFAVAETMPWFVALSLTASAVATIAITTAATAPPVLVADPAFVAEMPDAPGRLLKIGHFDEVDGVTHVEI
ncbi:MAG: hypothetical protein AAF596_10410 [Planctomycetota bacterium]